MDTPPSWWAQWWDQGRRWLTQPRRSPPLLVPSPGGLEPVVHPAQRRAQQEIERDLTEVLLGVVAQYGGLSSAELLQSEGLTQWVGQQLRTLTEGTPEWLQFVALVGAKKLKRRYLPPPLSIVPPSFPLPLPLDPTIMETSRSEIEPRDTVPVEEEEVTKTSEEVAPVVTTTGDTEEATEDRHVSFDAPVPEATDPLPETAPAPTPKRKRTATPSARKRTPPAATVPKPSDSPEPESVPPTAVPEETSPPPAKKARRSRTPRAKETSVVAPSDDAPLPLGEEAVPVTEL